MMSRQSLLTVCIIAATIINGSDAFTARSALQHTTAVGTSTSSSSALSIFGGKKQGEEEDLSFIETRDLTREEMLEINKRNEQVMNNELQAMTAISVLFSIPIFYLCWVAFFSE